MATVSTPSSAFSEAAVRSSVATLDPTLALLCLVQITGDRSLLGKFAPGLKGSQVNEGSTFIAAGSPMKEVPGQEADVVGKEISRKEYDAAVTQIRSLLVERLLTDPVPLLPRPDRALFAQMVEICLGFPVSSAHLDMALEQAGFVSDIRTSEPAKVPAEDFHVLVLGGGMIGINAAIKLQHAGFSYTVLEARGEVGGTWSINTYPNVAVDTPSVQYSYSFDINPSWSKYYPTGSEYLSYIQKVVKKFGIEEKIAFNTRVLACRWDAERNLWVVSAEQNGQTRTYEANAVISALGFLNRPSFPKVNGLDRFSGSVIHSAEWDASVDYTGKRVAVIGSGCTAVQVATGLADRVEKLIVVQRQPNWVTPNAQVLQTISDDERWALENIPFAAQWSRVRSFGTTFTDYTKLYKIDPEWQAQGGLISPMNDGLRQMCLDYIERSFADRPDLKAKLTPDFPPFAKRPIADCGYYTTLKKPNVELLEGGLVGAESDAIILSNGSRVECDAIVLATGFHIEFLDFLEITGLGGRTLKDEWAEAPRAYMGLTVPGFPNMFITCGPNSGLAAAHTTLGEEQIYYVIETLQAMVDNDFAALEVTEQACQAFNEEVDAEITKTVWLNSGTAHGYYRHSSGRIVLGFPFENVRYWQMTRKPRLEDYRQIPAQSPATAAALSEREAELA